MAILWNLVFQLDGLPISVCRADGVVDEPPAGLIRYVELSYGSWTTARAIDPSGTQQVEWPRQCILKELIGCKGETAYIARVTKPILTSTGEKTYPAGWRCDTCGNEEAGGLSSLTIDWVEPT
jgi:hypothetical protein